MVSPDGKDVYVANRYSNTVSEFSRNTTPARSTALSPASVASGEGPIGLSISANGKNVYAANSSSATVSEYSRNTTTGVLTRDLPRHHRSGSQRPRHRRQRRRQKRLRHQLQRGHRLAVLPQQRNRQTHRPQPRDGRSRDQPPRPRDQRRRQKHLHSEQRLPRKSHAVRPQHHNRRPHSNRDDPAGEYTECVAISPDGTNVYATNETTNTISEYSRNSETGVLTALTPTTIPTQSYPEGITISPDGNNLYTANNGSQPSRNTRRAASARHHATVTRRAPRARSPKAQPR